MIKRTSIIAIMLMVLGAGALVAQDSETHDISININAVALLDIIDGTQISLTAETTTAGAAPTGNSDTSKELRYTSVIDSGAGTSRNITAEITAGSVPSGLSVTIESSAPSGSGTVGSTAGSVTLSSVSAQSIITGIGSGNTGTTSGPTLTYQLSVDSIGDLDAANSGTVTVTLTITEEV